MMEKPKVGQVVRLNNYGIQHIGGLTSLEMVEQAKRLTITAVEDEPLTNDVPIWDVEVDRPLINQFMLDNRLFDLIEDVK